MYKWPLNVNNFSFLDRCKIACFILNGNNRWTQGDRVDKFEKEFADYVGTEYSVFVSSGSTANTAIAMYLKDNLYTPNKRKIIFPSTTWITSISPFIREGFEPVFVDVSLDDFALDLDLVNQYLSENDDVAAIFPTSLLGFVPDVDNLLDISESYNVKVMMDNCENTFGEFNNKNISSFFTSTTSTYFGHQLQSVEGGFIFTNCPKEYEYFRMVRNHGMTRSVSNSSDYENCLVDSRFDFSILGNNFRNTNINAFIGSIDLNKRSRYICKREELYQLFTRNLDSDKFLLPKNFDNRKHIPFSLPLISKDDHKKRLILDYCEINGIETRPIISGNLLRQTCFQKYANYKNFRNSEFLNNNGLYVGLYPTLNKSLLLELLKFVNTI